MLRCTFVLFWLSIPAHADNQSVSASEIERLSNTFSLEEATASGLQTAILLDGCFISFIDYFGRGHARVVSDDLSLISLNTNNNGDFMNSLRTDADWAALYFATSTTAVRAEYLGIPPVAVPQDVLASEPSYKSQADWAGYRNLWYPETGRVEAITEALIAYQSEYCTPNS